MNTPLIDSHCHLDFEPFDIDRESLIANLATKGVSDVVVPAVHKGNWQRVIDLCGAHENLHAALGIHPCFMHKAERKDCDELALMAQQYREQIVAIGECGLDFSLDTLEQQRHYFTFQIKLACELDLPLIIHHRNSHDIIWAFLRKFKPPKGGVIHAFSGSLQQAERYIDLGFKLGVGGTITYSRAQKTREVMAKVPVESLLLETDAPDMPIFGRQGERNSPYYLKEVFAVLCLLREQAGDELAKQLAQNTRQLFALKVADSKGVAAKARKASGEYKAHDGA